MPHARRLSSAGVNNCCFVKRLRSSMRFGSQTGVEAHADLGRLAQETIRKMAPKIFSWNLAGPQFLLLRGLIQLIGRLGSCRGCRPRQPRWTRRAESAHGCLSNDRVWGTMHDARWKVSRGDSIRRRVASSRGNQPTFIHIGQPSQETRATQSFAPSVCRRVRDVIAHLLPTLAYPLHRSVCNAGNRPSASNSAACA